MADTKTVATKEINPHPYNPRDRRRVMETELNLLLKKHNGMLTAEIVVEQAEDPTSALHGFFTWDDADAARKWRLIEARQLITSIRILQEGSEGKTRGLVSLLDDRHKGGGYRSLNDVMAEPTLRQHLLETALAELNAVQRKYQQLQELETVWGSVRSIEGEIVAGEPRNAAKG